MHSSEMSQRELLARIASSKAKTASVPKSLGSVRDQVCRNLKCTQTIKAVWVAISCRENTKTHHGHEAPDLGEWMPPTGSVGVRFIRNIPFLKDREERERVRDWKHMTYRFDLAGIRVVHYVLYRQRFLWLKTIFVFF